MREFLKKLIVLILLIAINALPIYAKNDTKFVSCINQDFCIEEIPEEIGFTTFKEIKIEEDLVIPENSVILAETMGAKKEGRWHRAGYLICKLKNYSNENTENPIDISDRNIYCIGKKYEALNKKDATIIGTELVLTQAASIVASCFIFLAPVDIAYFFTKGAIQREKHPNWFKAGVSNAYDNSIFWFWLKGKPIDMEEEDSVKLKKIKEKKALKLQQKYEKRKAKAEKKIKKSEETPEESENKITEDETSKNNDN